MELFKSTRLKVGDYILQKKCSGTKRKVFFPNLNEVKVIGIVWDSSNPEEFSHLSKFYQNMHDRNIKVKILGYFTGINLPDQYIGIRYLTLLRKQDVNFFYVPFTAEAINFSNSRFDVLIDINFNKLFPLHYISSLSKAGFKVGLFESEDAKTPFDLMMEIKKPVDIGNYLKEILHYLEMINSGDKISADKE